MSAATPRSLPDVVKAQRNEPVLTLENLDIFFEYLERAFMLVQVFSLVDERGDFHISLEELRDSKPTLDRLGMRFESANATFREMDEDHSGKVDFNEFSDWVLRKHFAHLDTKLRR
jgi:Ca2+-binding EF-hand superfamily protein